MTPQQPDSFRARVVDRRNLLILLGLLCQGFMVQTYTLTFAYLGLWLLCLHRQQPRRFLPFAMEDLVVLLALLLSFKLGAQLGYNRLVFVGNGLAVFQLLRLLWPLTPRDKAFSIAVAIIHLGIGSQVIVDYPFILIIGAALVLLPGALYDLKAGDFLVHGHGRYPQRRRREPLFLAVLMSVFFLAFPRFNVPVRSFTPEMASPAGRQRETLDMAGGGTEGSDRLIFRVDGDRLGYLKTMALDQFDGRTWSASPAMFAMRREPQLPETARIATRSVKIISASVLRNALPADGTVLAVQGPFYREPQVVMNGCVVLPFRVPAKISYTYTTATDPVPEVLSLTDIKRVLRLPNGISPRVVEWLDTLVGNQADPLSQAEIIKNHLKENFAYEIGAYSLDRLAPLDDFLFNERRGHCERFASALALLLRLRGIPSRVALGFVPVEKNEIGGYYNIRAKHAHAWTEAWFPESGWLVLDATPYGSGEVAPERRSFAFTLRDWLEYIWYGNIVEFSATEQFALANFMSRQLDSIGAAVHRWAVTLVTAGLTFTCLGLLLRYRRKHRRRRRQAPGQDEAELQKAVAAAQHFYGTMLRRLAKDKIFRAPQQTPLEFLRTPALTAHPRREELRLITEAFCSVRYGRTPMRQETEKEINAALARLHS